MRRARTSVWAGSLAWAAAMLLLALPAGASPSDSVGGPGEGSLSGSADQCPSRWSHPPTDPSVVYKTFHKPPDQSVPIYLDEYDPSLAPGAPASALVMVHGGGWIAGCRREYSGLAYTAATSYNLIVFVIDFRLACPPHARGYSEDTLPLCGWPYPKTDLDTGMPGASIQDVQDAIAWVRANAARYWQGFDGKVAAVGGSTGGNILLEAALTSTEAGRRPDAMATWSAKMELAKFADPSRGYTCDSSPLAAYCWKGEDRYMACTLPPPGCADTRPWYDASPYSRVTAYSPASSVPVFFSNGGSETCLPACPELVPEQEADDFGYALGANGFPPSTYEECEVATSLHGTTYLGLSCVEHPGETVYDSTINFLKAHM